MVRVWAALSIAPRGTLPPMVGSRTTWPVALFTVLAFSAALALSVTVDWAAAMTSFAMGKSMGVRTAL